MVDPLQADAVAAIHEAELRVQTSISVREQYKSKLRTLVDALLPPTKCAFPSKPSPAKAATTDASKKKQLRDVIADRQRVRATMPAGKELQVVGDWLLLLRAASVNVVEGISHWRSVVHQGRALPYEVDKANYLLCMAHDVDFLDACDDLVSWLGFRLVRNPFITREALDNAAESRSTVSDKRRPLRNVAGSPPALLVKPLVSILPEDDVVDGSRIASAQSKLIEEEALYGRSSAFEYVEKYFAKATSALNVGNTGETDTETKQHDARNIFEAIAASTKSLRAREHHLMVLQRDHVRVSDLTTQLEHQIRLTKHHSDHDLVSDHRVWQFREQCRLATLRTANAWLLQLQSRLEILNSAVRNAQNAADKARNELDALIRQREQARLQRRQEADELERRKSTIRRKTLERSHHFKVNRPKKAVKPAPQDEPHPSVDATETPEDDFVQDVNQALGAPPSPVDNRVELDHKRQENWERRRQLQVEHDRITSEETRELDRRRNENAQMFLEDRQSTLIEIRRRHVLHKKFQRERVRKLTAAPIFSTVQLLGGVGGGGNDKKFRIAVYDHRAKGYTLDGLRFVAYDPSTSSSLTLVLSTREYKSLGYGCTQDGLSAFCQWLCVVYDRRSRQRKLVWSGAPCPPPLRVREYDHALLCVHKEGLRVIQYGSSSYHLVAAYVRTSDTSKLHFVISSMMDGVDTVVEIAVAASQLLPSHSMLVRSDFDGGRSYTSWLHELEADHPSSGSDDESVSTRVFSGEMKGLLGGHINQTTRVHVYDASPTEYELRFVKQTPHNDRGSGSGVGSNRVLVLLKNHVNPYSVRLPHSAFGDLLTNLRFEEDDAGEQSRAVLLPTWRACLAQYVRAIRMAKFGCKIDGVFHLVVVTLVQQKTEFRAHLLFELTAIGVEIGARQSLRIALSQFLRCPDTIWRSIADGNSTEAKPLVCETCLFNKQSLDVSSQVQYATEVNEDVPEAAEPHGGNCEACRVAQQTRLQILHSLLEGRALVANSSLEYLYYGACEVCGALPPPILVAIDTTSVDEDLDTRISQYFSVFSADVDLIDADKITNIRDSLEHNRLCVVRVRIPSIPTQSIVCNLADRIRTSLVADHEHEMPITIAVVVTKLDIFQLRIRGDDEHDTELGDERGLVEALHNLAAAIVHVGQLEPTMIDSEADEARESVFNFETYLVSEALLVEATRVILHPDIEWRLPGETVGASSWSTACEFLQYPSQPAADLQHRQHDLVSMSKQTRSVLDAYTEHPKWPTAMESVRAPFQPLLSTILHVVYVQHLLGHGGGVISSHSDGSTTHDEGNIYEFDKNVSVITISHQTGSADIGQSESVY